MKKPTLYRGILLFVLSAFAQHLFAQPLDYKNTKEKVYIHTNHVFFKPGDGLYFKLYLVDARNQTPSHLSGNVYVEVLNPAGNVLQKQNYYVANGYAEGSFDFDAQAVGGIYKLRAYTSWMQNENDSTFFTKEITVQKVLAPRILMKLDFPKKGYGAGDEVVADYSVRSLDDRPIKGYEAKFAVSIAGQTVETSMFKTDNSGKAQVKFYLPKDLKSNDGLLNITITYDSYTEAISRSIPIVLNKIDLQFMPEGGSLVAGIHTQVAFKALNENGKAADIKGEIWDNDGQKIVAFESYHFGMGKFPFRPEQGKTYTARITSPAHISQAYALPTTAAFGVVMNATQSDDHVYVKIASSAPAAIRLVGQTKNTIFYDEDFLLKKHEQTIRIDAAAFPAGIAQFTVYLDDSLPVAERLCFLNPNKILQVKLTADKQKYLPREKVTMTLKTMDENNKPVPSNFSLSVVDDKLWSFADDKQDHILSWLLIGSELKGKIEEPQFYFKKEELKAMPALDLVMMTHGYRYFDYIEYVQQEHKLKFMPDMGNIITGVVRNDKQQPIAANIFMIDGRYGGKAIQMTTDTSGAFIFSEVSPNSSYYLIAQSLRKKEKAVIQVLQNGVGFNPLRRSRYNEFATNPLYFKTMQPDNNIQLAKFKRQEAAFMDKEMKFGANEQMLNDVVVTGYGVQRKMNATGAVAIVKGADLIAPMDIATALQGRVPGLNVINAANTPDTRIQIRGVASLAGNNAPLFVLNGIPMDKLDMNINPNDIDNITVLKDASATALYGSRAANGVVLVESKKWRNEKLKIDFAKKSYYATQHVQTPYKVYQTARKFYAPLYTTTETETRNDFRETIYWNPVVQTDKTGTATVEFYNSDATTTFRAIAEGIGYNGKLGRTESTYAVQNAISTDAKIPPYLTVGDQALIPLVIKNNTDGPMGIEIDIDPISDILIGEFEREIKLSADSSKQVLVPIEATKQMADILRFRVRGPFGKETIELPISATGKGFPVIETFSGNTSNQYHFNINKMIPGSLHSELKLFQSLEGQLLDGIESMLREPGGCFEQTSSSTYPNMFVLKYLRESGKSNPAIEKSAMDYIQKGYQRLIGFETSQNGFEWFGHAPAHEALTAYGLLEFTDMKQFVKVDEKMMERTKKFLMDRRDGQGGFKLASGGYDRFASVPNKIANIYIVYALTQAGIGAEIKPEYEAAVKQAVKSNDGYQLCMMALAASNMHNEKDYIQLMQLANTSYQQKQLASETSVVNSRDASLRVEAMALYAMALTRDKNPDLGLVGNAISKILGEKSYYGYGSTQATVLALQAVVEYSKLAGNAASKSQVAFTLNNSDLQAGQAAPGLHEGNNAFSVQYGQADSNVPYNFEVAYNTFTPPNSDKAQLQLTTKLDAVQTKVGQTVRMTIDVKNQDPKLQPMAIAKIGIPAGLSLQPWQLKELTEKNEVAYYEIFDNYLVFYWMGFAANETKCIHLDLKSEIPGTYTAKASTTYLYYTPEYRNWNDGTNIKVLP